jgi:hypothetical protein
VVGRRGARGGCCLEFVVWVDVEPVIIEAVLARGFGVAFEDDDEEEPQAAATSVTASTATMVETMRRSREQGIATGSGCEPWLLLVKLSQ